MSKLKSSKGLKQRFLARWKSAQTRFRFHRDLTRFLKNPEASLAEGNPLLTTLVTGWDNKAWSAQEALLRECVMQALTTKGPILECGSGLSTLLIGAIASRRNIPLYSLEHSERWKAQLDQLLRRYRIANTKILFSPIRSYGDYDWYDHAEELDDIDFTLILCDGPPGTTKGGRFGLLPQMRNNMASPCLILVDDIQRTEEQIIVERWTSEFQGIHYRGTATSYAVLEVV